MLYVTVLRLFRAKKNRLEWIAFRTILNDFLIVCDGRRLRLPVKQKRKKQGTNELTIVQDTVIYCEKQIVFYRKQLFLMKDRIHSEYLGLLDAPVEQMHGPVAVGGILL